MERAYQIVFFDIDGTLVNEAKEIPADTVEAVRELRSRGVEAVIATGRAPYFFKPMAEKLGIESFVCLNGAYVVYRGQVIYKHAIPLHNLELLVAQAARHQHPLVFEGAEAYYANEDGHPHLVEAVASLRVDFPGYDPDYWKKTEVFQAFLHCRAHEEHLYQESIGGLRLVRWHDKAMDVLPEGSSKAKGIEAMLRYLNLTTQDAVAFGDGLNDKEMLEFVGLGVAMGNSHEELKPLADYITDHVDEGGIRNGLRYARLIG